MAEPILLEIPTRDPRAELLERLENAPAEHAEALLSGYEVIQGLHDAGILNLLRGVLFSGEQVLEDAVDAANKPGSLAAIRNLVILARLAESINPEQFEKLALALPAVITVISNAHSADPPTLWQSIKIAKGANIRRGLAAINGALQAVRESVTKTKVPTTANCENT